MEINYYGEICLSEQEIFDLLYSGKIKNLTDIFTDTKTADSFNQAIANNKDDFDKLSTLKNKSISIKEFDKNNQKNWFFPENYKNLDIESWLISQCSAPEEIDRVNLEIDFFKKHEMTDVLKYLKFLVDTMRKNNIVWGVGRGSSVASFCLYLIGIHKINSIKYNLDITEFLK